MSEDAEVADEQTDMALETTPPPRHTLNIYQRLNAVMHEVRDVAKTRKSAQNYKYTGHEDVTEPLRDALVKHGVLETFSIIDAQRAGSAIALKIEVEYINIDDPSDKIVRHSYGESLGTPVKGSDQFRPDDLQTGKAASYALKTFQLKFFMLLGDSTPDNEANHGREYTAQQPVGQALAPGGYEQFVQAYQYVNSQGSLDELRRSISSVVRNLTSQQVERLAALDRQAQGNLSRFAQETR